MDINTLENRLSTEEKPQLRLILQRRIQFCRDILPDLNYQYERMGRGKAPEYAVETRYNHESGDPSDDELREVLFMHYPENADEIKSLKRHDLLTYPDIERKMVPAPPPEPKVIIKEVQVKDQEAEQRLENVLQELERVREENKERRPEPAPEQPPEAIADLFQADRPYAEQAKALWKRYNELTNKIMLKVATDAEIRKHERLQGELDWIKRHAFEGV